jgi:site-specific recombinase XerC
VWTRKLPKTHIANFFNSDVASRTSLKLPPAAVRDWFFHGRSERNWRAQTFRTYHKSLKVFFRWCCKQSCLATDPLADLAMPRAERTLPPRLTREEALRLLEITLNYLWADAFLHRNHAIIATFLFAGLRKSELLFCAAREGAEGSDRAGVRVPRGDPGAVRSRAPPTRQDLPGILRPARGERRTNPMKCCEG